MQQLEDASNKGHLKLSPKFSSPNIYPKMGLFQKNKNNLRNSSSRMNRWAYLGKVPGKSKNKSEKIRKPLFIKINFKKP